MRWWFGRWALITGKLSVEWLPVDFMVFEWPRLDISQKEFWSLQGEAGSSASRFLKSTYRRKIFFIFIFNNFPNISSSTTSSIHATYPKSCERCIPFLKFMDPQVGGLETSIEDLRARLEDSKDVIGSWSQGISNGESSYETYETRETRLHFWDFSVFYFCF